MSLLKRRPEFRPFLYPKAEEFRDAQLKNHWNHNTIDVRADVLGYETAFTDAEKHGITTVLKLFTNYEIFVGDYWIDVVRKWMQNNEIQSMATCFADIEATHARFYDKLNDALGLSTKKFYLSFMDNPDMAERMDFVAKKLQVASVEQLPLSLATFSFIEGVTLYSSFAFLMSFQRRQPKPMLSEVCTGLGYSVFDESVHAAAGSWLFNQFLHENTLDVRSIEPQVQDIARTCCELEFKIIEEIFSEGPIEGIDAESMRVFIQDRANKKLADINCGPLYTLPKNNPIADWFYQDLKLPVLTDFFQKKSRDYTKDWDFSGAGSWNANGYK